MKISFWNRNTYKSANKEKLNLVEVCGLLNSHLKYQLGAVQVLRNIILGFL